MAREESAKEFGVAKAAPIKRYAEEPTFLGAAGDLSGRSVLDLACGSGFYTRALKQRGAARTVGVDISHDMIAAARDAEAQAPLGIEYLRRDVLEMETVGNFDVVSAAYLFVYAETLQALRTMCSVVARHLVPSGRLVATMIHPDLSLDEQMPIEKTGGLVELANGGPLTDGAPLTVTIGPGRHPYRARDYYWTAATFEASLREAGFSEITWRDPAPSEEGRARLGADFWTEYLRNPTIAVLTALRS